MSMQLKILDQRHKQKLNLKALDAVLFGPPLRESAACSPYAKLGRFLIHTHSIQAFPSNLSSSCRSTT